MAFLGQHLVNTLQKITPRFPQVPMLDFFTDMLIIAGIMTYPLMSLTVTVFPQFPIQGLMGVRLSRFKSRLRHHKKSRVG